MFLTDVQPMVQLAATVIGISGGLLGLYKYFSDRRDHELREWQKVVIYKLFRRNELKAQSFNDILSQYRGEAQAVAGIDLKKKELSEDTLRRILIELASSGILSMQPGDSFQLKVTVAKVDASEQIQQINDALVEVVGANPHVYTLDEVLKEIAPKLHMAIPLLRNTINMAIREGNLVLDEKGHVSFPQ